MATTEVIYCRVPTSLKAQIQERADQRGAKIGAAVTDLLTLGVEAESSGFPSRMVELEHELAEESRLRAEAEQQQAALRQAVHVWTDRASQQLADCPHCKKPITGSDLLVGSQCPACHKPLTPLLTPAPAAGIDQKDVLMLLAAAGLVLGIVALSRGK
ncbi:MAG TPA: hypothetical protein VGM10_16870 [Actinocrinis sp.]|jgi:hypothetical protein